LANSAQHKDGGLRSVTRRLLPVLLWRLPGQLTLADANDALNSCRPPPDEYARIEPKYISVYTSEVSFLSRICSALSTARLRYAVVGGHAVALHGAVRGTVDVDIVLAWNRKTLQQAEATLHELGLISRLPISANDVFNFRDEYVANRNMVAWNFYNPKDPSEQLDIIICYDLTGKRSKRIETADGSVVILGRNDLIEMKRESGRPQDLEDIRAMEKLK